ncbi:MAG: galactokinase [Puniceicoccaceae bacterium]|nr:MAG: galactokinase [Puniceicoccaceae bacterium]
MHPLHSSFEKRFGQAPAVIARAPGRIEFIGNHTDYNGGAVLGASIQQGVTVAAGLRRDGCIQLATLGGGPAVRLDELPKQGRSGSESWINYPVGVAWELFRERTDLQRQGWNLLVESDLPTGAGLSSSAALELSSALALHHLTGLDWSRRELVLAARRAENDFVGVPCGILDQGVSGYGSEDALVFIDCRGPDFSTVPLPAGVRFWIFNTHQKHALVDSLYSQRHNECRQALRLLQAAGRRIEHLIDLPADEVDAAVAEFPAAVARRARHVIHEHHRVLAAVDRLGGGDLAGVGELLYASHHSSSELFENATPELDFLVANLRGRPGVIGARLTGGGFGGAVMAVTDESYTREAAESVARAYRERFGSPLEILPTRPGPGARLLYPEG